MANRTIEECESVRLVSEEPRKLAHKVLYQIAEYMPRIEKALIETSSRIQSRKEQEGMELLHQVTTTWLELYQGLQSALTVTGMDIDSIQVNDQTFSEINIEIQDFLDEIQEMVKEQRFLELSDLLEYEIAPRVPLIHEAILLTVRELEKQLH